PPKKGSKAIILLYVWWRMGWWNVNGWIKDAPGGSSSGASSSRADSSHCQPWSGSEPLRSSCYELGRQLEGTVEADDLYHTEGHAGQAKQGGKKVWERRPRGRRKKREPDRGHYDKDRPVIIAWVSRQGAVVIHATKDFMIQTAQKAANLAVQVGSRLYTDSASSYRAVKGYVHAFVNHTQKEYARGDVHENRAECLFSLLKP